MLAMILAAVLLFLSCVVGATEALSAEGLSGNGVVPEPMAFETRTLELIDVPGLVTGVAVSPDGTLLAVSGGVQRSMGRLTVWNLEDGTKRFATKRPELVRSLAFSPDGQHLAIGDLRGGVGIWHAGGARTSEAEGSGIWCLSPFRLCGPAHRVKELFHRHRVFHVDAGGCSVRMKEDVVRKGVGAEGVDFQIGILGNVDI